MTKKIPLIAVLSADWHFCHNKWKHRPEINGDAATSLLQVYDDSTDYGLPVIAAGDLFDKPRPTIHVIDLLNEVFAEYTGHKQLCYHINGNSGHDKVKPPWMSALFGHGTTNQNWHDLTTCCGSLDTQFSVEELDESWTEELPAWTTATRNWLVHGIDHVETREKLQEELDRVSLSATLGA